MICKLCEVPFEPKRPGQKYCAQRCSNKVKNILNAYMSGRGGATDFPKGLVEKVMKEYNIPVMGINFDEGRNSFKPSKYSGKIQY